MSSDTIYAPACNECGWWGQGVTDSDTALREKDMHWAETSHSDIKITINGEWPAE